MKNAPAALHAAGAVGPKGLTRTEILYMKNDVLSTETAKPSYWAVLPAAVRYDPAIPASAKLLYAEISALTDGRGFCWASNAYFERLYDLSERTIIRLIRALEAAGYIRIEDADGGAATRKIYAGVNPMDTSSAAAAAPSPQGEGETPDKNVSTPRQKCQGGGDKNVTHNRKENKKENDPPVAPQGAGADFVPKKAPDWKPERFARFWDYYPLHKSKQAAIRAWDKLKPSDELLKVIGIALRRQKAACSLAGDEWKLHASTYLNNARWTDESDIGLPPKDTIVYREEALPWI